jgi:hypothetical protein
MNISLGSEETYINSKDCCNLLRLHRNESIFLKITEIIEILERVPLQRAGK